MLLAIDTSSGTSVAVVDRDRGVISERTEADTRRHAEVIGELISECLSESGVAIAALSGVAVGMGPGPFTGLRVGIAAAQAFALGAGKPTVRVTSHDAIAFGHFARAENGPLLVVTDARRREVYWSAYSGADEQGLPQIVAGPGLAAPAELATLPALEAHGGYDAFRLLEHAAVSAGDAGMLAETLYEHGRPFAAADALYLRSPDVTPSTRPKRVS